MEIPTLRQDQESGPVQDNVEHAAAFFEGGERGYLKELFVYMLGFANRPLLCIGEEGVGKTMLLSQVQLALSASCRICQLRAPLFQEEDSLALEIANQLKINTGRGERFSVDDLVSRLGRLRKSGEHVVVMVDDAEQLSEGQVALLARLYASDDEPSFSILMMARKQTDLLLGHLSSQLRLFQLNPFDENVSAEYIQWRITQQGLPVPSPARISGLAVQSEGIAARIETLLQQGAEPRSANASLSGTGIVKKAGWLLLAVVLGLVLLFQEQINQIIMSDSETVSMDEQAETLPLPAKPTVASPEVGQVLPALPESASTMVDLTEEAVVAEVPQPAEESEMSQAGAAEVEEVMPVDVVGEDVTSEEAEPTGQAEVETEVAVAPIEREPKRLAAPADDVIKGVAWIFAQDPAHYTFHVMSVRNEDNLKAYIKKSGITERVAYYKAERKSGEWYVLLYGVYPDSKSAYGAHEQLVKQLKVKDAFVRSFGDVQKDVAEPLN